jgi:hypothetical protein
MLLRDRLCDEAVVENKLVFVELESSSPLVEASIPLWTDPHVASREPSPPEVDSNAESSNRVSDRSVDELSAGSARGVKTSTIAASRSSINLDGRVGESLVAETEILGILVVLELEDELETLDPRATCHKSLY